MSQRWIYQVIETKPDFLGRQNTPEPLQDVLNRQGAQGWELIGFIPGSTWVQQRLIFKKPG
ncbi:MAG: DUF4177 domain-containing protein [Lysobacter sp.]